MTKDSLIPIPLLRCPFCGSEAEQQVEQYTQLESVFCSDFDCMANIQGIDKEEAIHLWNRRTV